MTRRSSRLNVSVCDGFSLNRRQLEEALLAEQQAYAAQQRRLQKANSKKKKPKKRSKDSKAKTNVKRQKTNSSTTDPSLQSSILTNVAVVPPNPIKSVPVKSSPAKSNNTTKSETKSDKENKNAAPEHAPGQRYAVKHSKHHVSVKRLLLDDALKSNTTMEGWSNARKRAYSQREVCPNAYYYRFNDPGEQQAKGGWSPSEKKLFFERKEALGGIDYRWGIFAMGIPGRVGYQCSNYYRKLIEKGEITDENYVFDPKTGKAKFMHVKGVGSKGQNGGGKKKKRENPLFTVAPNGCLITLTSRKREKKVKGEIKKKRKKIPEFGEEFAFNSIVIFNNETRERIQVKEGEAIFTNSEIYYVSKIVGKGVIVEDALKVQPIIKARRLYTLEEIKSLPGGNDAVSSRKSHDATQELFDSLPTHLVDPSLVVNRAVLHFQRNIYKVKKSDEQCIHRTIRYCVCDEEAQVVLLQRVKMEKVKKKGKKAVLKMVSMSELRGQASEMIKKRKKTEQMILWRQQQVEIETRNKQEEEERERLWEEEQRKCEMDRKAMLEQQRTGVGSTDDSYEAQRLEQIRKNKELLASLGLA